MSGEGRPHEYACAVAFLAAIAVGGVAYVFLYPLLSGERQAEKRRASVARAEPAARADARRSRRSRRDVRSRAR